MLRPAIAHAGELNTIFQSIIDEPRYKFFCRTPGHPWGIEIFPDTWAGVQFVSLDESGRVIGYFSAKINRLTQTGYDLEAINFKPQQDPVFTRDIAEFILTLFHQFGLKRLTWSVVVGNPVERMYNRCAGAYGERIVGTFKNEVMLSDGQLYDLKFYEVFKEDFSKAVDAKGATVFNYRDISKEVANHE